MRISYWSSDVCSSELHADARRVHAGRRHGDQPLARLFSGRRTQPQGSAEPDGVLSAKTASPPRKGGGGHEKGSGTRRFQSLFRLLREKRKRLQASSLSSSAASASSACGAASDRSEEHTSELQSLMRQQYGVFCL